MFLELLLISISLFVVVVFGYHLLILCLSRLFPRPVLKKSFFPTLSLVIPTYNECASITQKLLNTLALSYPSQKLGIAVVDSGSNDGTQEKVAEFQRDHPSIVFLQEEERRGKPSAINFALQHVSGEIVVLTDANAVVAPDALENLVRSFSDNRVGAVVGNVQIPKSGNVVSNSESSWISVFRERLRIAEAKLDSTSYFSGELCAFRRNLVKQIHPNVLSDDLEIMLTIREAGYRCISEPTAFVWENRPTNVWDQIKTRRRTVTGTLQSMSNHRRLFFRPQYGFFGNLILPAYLIRLILTPFLMLSIQILLILTILEERENMTVVISEGSELIYDKDLGGLAVIVILILMICFAVLALRPLLRIFFFSLIIQFSLLAGIFDFLFRRPDVRWAKAASSRKNPEVWKTNET